MVQTERKAAPLSAKAFCGCSKLDPPPLTGSHRFMRTSIPSARPGVSDPQGGRRGGSPWTPYIGKWLFVWRLGGVVLARLGVGVGSLPRTATS